MDSANPDIMMDSSDLLQGINRKRKISEMEQSDETTDKIEPGSEYYQSV